MVSRIAHLRRAATALACATVVGLTPACGGSDEPGSAAGPALAGVRVSDREQALQIVARGVVAPLYASQRAHAVLAHAFELRSIADDAGPAAAAGDRWAVDALAPAMGGAGTVAIEIEAADHAEGLMLRGEAGFVRALLRFERAADGAAPQLEGTIVLEVSRTVSGEGAARRSRADALSIADGQTRLQWSYLDISVDVRQQLQRLGVVSDVPVGTDASAWIDALATEPARLAPAASGLSSGRFVAAGVIGFLNARLTLQVAADGGWTIDVDNDKDDRIDFVVQASAQEARALMSGL